MKSRTVSRLGRCTRGASVVEFALVTPLFFALVCGIVEFSRLYYVRLTVRDITVEATRFAVTGRQLNDPMSGQPMTRAASIRQLIKDRAKSRLVTVDSVVINPSDGGQPGDVVQIRAFYNYQFSLAPLRGIAPQGVTKYSVGSSMKNEPVF
jgi:Flp pilus assembly protein TadG